MPCWNRHWLRACSPKCVLSQPLTGRERSLPSSKLLTCVDIATQVLAANSAKRSRGRLARKGLTGMNGSTPFAVHLGI